MIRKVCLIAAVAMTAAIAGLAHARLVDPENRNHTGDVTIETSGSFLVEESDGNRTIDLECNTPVTSVPGGSADGWARFYCLDETPGTLWLTFFGESDGRILHEIPGEGVSLIQDDSIGSPETGYSILQARTDGSLSFIADGTTEKVILMVDELDSSSTVCTDENGDLSTDACERKWPYTLALTSDFTHSGGTSFEYTSLEITLPADTWFSVQGVLFPYTPSAGSDVKVTFDCTSGGADTAEILYDGAWRLGSGNSESGEVTALGAARDLNIGAGDFTWYQPFTIIIDVGASGCDLAAGVAEIADNTGNTRMDMGSWMTVSPIYTNTASGPFQTPMPAPTPTPTAAPTPTPTNSPTPTPTPVLAYQLRIGDETAYTGTHNDYLAASSVPTGFGDADNDHWIAIRFAGTFHTSTVNHTIYAMGTHAVGLDGNDSTIIHMSTEDTEVDPWHNIDCTDVDTPGDCCTGMLSGTCDQSITLQNSIVYQWDTSTSEDELWADANRQWGPSTDGLNPPSSPSTSKLHIAGGELIVGGNDNYEWNEESGSGPAIYWIAIGVDSELTQADVDEINAADDYSDLTSTVTDKVTYAWDVGASSMNTLKGSIDLTITGSNNTISTR